MQRTHSWDWEILCPVDDRLSEPTKNSIKAKYNTARTVWKTAIDAYNKALQYLIDKTLNTN